MNIHEIWAGVVGGAAIAGGFWAIGKYGPGFLVGQLHDLFNEAKDSQWARAKPARAKLLLAFAELLEQEIPEPGEGQEFYDTLGAAVAGRIGIGSATQWSKVLRQFGDAVDTELDAEIKLLATQEQPGTPPAKT